MKTKGKKKRQSHRTKTESAKLVRKNFHPATSESVTRANTTSRGVSSLRSTLERHVRIFPTHRGSALSKRGRYISPPIRRLDDSRRKRESHRKFSSSLLSSVSHPLLLSPSLFLTLSFPPSEEVERNSHGEAIAVGWMDGFSPARYSIRKFSGSGQRSFHWLPTGS